MENPVSEYSDSGFFYGKVFVVDYCQKLIKFEQ